MKKSQWKDLLRGIVHSKGRYLSLLFIVALGVAFYAGVRSAEPDMKLSADIYYDQTDLMDIRVVGSLGLTDDDVEAVSKVEGIEAAEGAYFAEVLTEDENDQLVIDVMSTCEQMNQLTIEEGRLPQKSGECFVDTLLIQKTNHKIGDTITFVSGDENELSDTLKQDTYTITGYGTYSYYLSWDRGTASIGDGDVDAFVMLTKDDFALEVYTSIYATTKDTKSLNTFSDEYEDAVESVKDGIEEIEAERCSERYNHIKEEGESQIESAQNEIESAQNELSDAKKELEDGEKEVAEKESEVADGEEKLKDGEQELEDASKEIEEGESSYQDGLAKYESAQAKLEKEEKTLKDSETKLASAKKEVSTNEKKLTESKKELDDAKTQLDSGRASYEAGKQQVSQLNETLTTLKSVEKEQATLIKQSLWADAQTQQLLISAGVSGPEDKNFTKALSGIIKNINTELTTFEKSEEAYNNGLTEYNKGKKELEAAKKQIATNEKKISSGKKQLEAGKKELASSKKSLDSAKKKLDTAKKEYEDGVKELEENRKELEDAKAKIKDAKKELKDGWKDYNEANDEAQEKITKAKKELADGKKDLEELEMPEWYILDRNSIQTYVEYGMDAERIGAIGKVFPAIFFLVAALVSLTTMTRMIEEERTLIGTLKALGYGKGAIAAKYILYALSATLVGGILGVCSGSKVLPWVIIEAYKILYQNLQTMVLPIHVELGALAIGIAVVCTVGAAILACYKELLTQAAQLMRPPSPKQGKRVFLEHFPFIWKRLSFSKKATVRNLTRYKKRFFMTVFGIGGCMALLMVGFGLQDAIAQIVNNQYTNIWTYDVSITLDEDASLEAKENYATELLKSDENIKENQLLRLVSIDVTANEIEKSAYLYVPESIDNLDDFVILKNRLSHEKYEMSDEGVIITEKLSSLLNVEVGDTLTLKESDTKTYEVKILAISENYLYHYIYMTKNLYQNLYGEEPEYNQLHLKLSEGASEVSRNLLSDDMAKSVSYVTDLQKKVDDMMNSLNFVVWVLILSAGLLAFVVLFNLNNINITERRRELATLKVLGFYDTEVASYVYRENVILTILGIGVGIVLGIILHQYVIRTCEIDMLMFGRYIKPRSYLYSSLLTAMFSVIVNFVMYFHLKKIDMIESLKSVE